VLGNDVAVEFELDTNLWPVVIDPGSLEQILLNLAVNARDAMPGGGRLRVVATNAKLDEGPRVGRGRRLSAGDYALIAVTDTGVGVSPELQGRIFEPLFTTKEPGVGTGLGLSTCLALVEQAGGAISVESTTGKGATFRIYLPRAEATPVLRVATRSPSPPRGSQRIGIVEVDEHVRASMARSLCHLGYDVVEVDDVQNATAMLSSTPIDLLIADVQIPGSTGAMLVDRLRQDHAALRVLYVSGGTGETPRSERSEADPILIKPFAPSILARRVRDALARPLAVVR
jgi:CheY-like chemotaxis protein